MSEAATAGTSTLAIVVLISGSGTNLQAILNNAAESSAYRVAGVISDQPNAFGLQRARMASVNAYCVERREFADHQTFEAALKTCIERLHPGLIVMAGFMRILSDAFINAFRGRMLNIHPSLLPRYRGLNTHRRVLDAGDRDHGTSVHFVTAELDSGPVIIQARVPVLGSDDENRLRARVLEREHLILPMAIKWFATGRIKMHDNKVWLDGRCLEQPYFLD